jgi:glycosyltransferase involved in cell wall biosynthesis
MHIGIDAARAFDAEPTGTEVYTRALLDRFPDLAPAHRFTYFVANPPRFQFPKNVAVEVLRWPVDQLWHQIRLSIRLLSRRPDVLFVPAHTVPLVHPLPTVTTIHDIGFEERPDLYDPRPLGRGLSRWLGEAAIRAFSRGRYGASEIGYHRWSLQRAMEAQAVLTVSRFTADRIRTRFPHHPPLIPIPNGFSYLPTRSGSPVPYPYVLYVGRLERKKNLSGMLAAFAEFVRQNPKRQERLVLVGKPGYGFSSATSLLENEPLKNRVVMLGWQPESSVMRFLQHASALLFVSAYEGFGIPVLQAFAAGVPVVASDIPALREVGGHAAQFVPLGNPVVTAQALHAVVSNGVLRARLTAAGRDRVTRYSWERCAHETLQVLLTVGYSRDPRRALQR